MIFGERKYSMRLWLDPARLAARRITAGDVVNALREQNVQVAAGSVGDAPAREGQSYQISVRAAGRLREVSEFENIIVKAGNAGRSCASGRRHGGTGRRDLLVHAAVHGVRGRGLRRHGAPPPTRSTSSAGSSRNWSGSAAASRPG
jgi:multidrug efflux pump subunit AcrB